MITPTIGRMVHYFPSEGSLETHAAIITGVHPDNSVDVTAFPPGESPRQHQGVYLRNDSEPLPVGPRCEWMPYQVGQAAKTEELQQKLNEGAPPVSQ